MPLGPGALVEPFGRLRSALASGSHRTRPRHPGQSLALRVVERYFGREVAEQTASYIEYESKGWIPLAASGAERLAAATEKGD